MCGEEYKLWSSSLCSFLASCQIIPLRSKYYSQHPVLRHLQSVFFPSYDRPSFTPTQTNKMIVLYILIFTFLDENEANDSALCGSKYGPN
jgi:hypothetical protein